MIHTKSFIIVCTLAFCCCSTGGALTNPGFETGDFTGWTMGGNAVSGVALNGTPISGTNVTNNIVRSASGSYAAFAKLQTAATATSFSLEQSVADLLPSTGYYMVMKWGIFGDVGQSCTVTMKQYVDGVASGGTGSLTMSAQPSAFVTSNTLVFTPASGTTHSFRWEFTGGRTSDGSLIGISVDDLSVVPEPTSLCVLLPAGAGVFLRRRRR